MATLKLEIITPERAVFADDVDIVLAPGSLGRLGIMPHHIPLITSLEPGEMVARKGEQSFYFAVSGGFLTVENNTVTVLADTAERAEEINLERAGKAKEKVQKEIKKSPGYNVDEMKMEAALMRSLVRLKVGQRKRKIS